MAGALWFSIVLLLSGWLKPADNESMPKTLCDLLSTLHLPTSKMMDLNGTFFINNIMMKTSRNSYDSIDVDIGTTSCGSFDDKACYVTCSSRHVEQTSECYVTVNVTCDVDNVKGRYVRIRQNNVAGLVMCDVNVTGWPDLNEALKNVALNAPCSQSGSYSDWTPGRAVDGNRDGTMVGHSCSHTEVLNKNNTQHIHWWQVDLGKLILVSYIFIANRVDSCCYQRLANFTVELGRVESKGNITYSLCSYFEGIAGPLTTLNCTRSIWGQFVRISKTGETLTLCEVEVYGDTDNNSTGPFSSMSLIPTDLSCDDAGPLTSLATTEMTTATMKSTMPLYLTTEEKEFEMFSEATSEAKVSTVNPEFTDETTVSTVYPDTTERFTSDAPIKPIYCACSCWNAKNKKGREEVQEEMSQTAKALKMQSSDLGQQIRKKSSVPDHRLSSAVMGVACVIAFSSIFAAIILSDICHLCQYLWTKKGEKGKEKKGKVAAGLENRIHFENCQ